MNLSHVKRLAAGVVVCLTALSALSGCQTTTASSAVANEGDANAKTMNVGFFQSMSPYDFVDENGQPDGYDIQVLKKVDEALPQYKFDFHGYDFANLIVSLDSGKVDLASSKLALNDKRKAKYEYTRTPYLYNPIYFIKSNKDKSIQTIEDLAGKTVAETSGTDEIAHLEQYNKDHPDKAVNIQYGDVNWEAWVAGIDNGSIAATPDTPITLDLLNEKYGNKLAIPDKPWYVQTAGFLISPKEQQLRKDIDGALSKLRDDGTLKKLSEKYLGGDYTTDSF